MKDLPENYALYWLADYAELIAPTGKTVKRYSPQASFSQVVKDAWKYRAETTFCGWDDCPLCNERGLVA